MHLDNRWIRDAAAVLRLDDGELSGILGNPPDAMRSARLVCIAQDLMVVAGSPEAARRWLRSANQAFAGKCPLDVLRGEDGADQVMGYLNGRHAGMS